jgi:hypothetical protein
MKILYLSGPEKCNYLRDMLAHGFRTLFGPDFVDVVKLDALYNTYPEIDKLYGHGFTLYGLLPDIPVDRTDIIEKIKTNYFDLIVLNVPRIDEQSDLFRVQSVFLDHYPANKIVYLDGNDDPNLYRSLMDSGLFFKREMHHTQKSAFPIQFCIPEEKIKPYTQKDYLMAPLDPWDPRTYIYTDESSYYFDYQRSYYARTSMKCGWDCLRHYEIMAANCMPYFENLENCPVMVMTKLPKVELMKGARMLEQKNGGLFLSSVTKHTWEDLMVTVRKQLIENLTTKAMATYVLDTVKQVQGSTVEMVGA